MIPEGFDNIEILDLWLGELLELTQSAEFIFGLFLESYRKYKTDLEYLVNFLKENNHIGKVYCDNCWFDIDFHHPRLFEILKEHLELTEHNDYHLQVYQLEFKETKEEEEEE